MKSVLHTRIPFFFFIALFLAALFIPGDSAAEGIYLADGRVIYGRILSQDDTSMQVRTSYGVMRLRKADIKKIDYDLGLGTVTVIMKDNTLISGTLISITANKVIVRDGTIDHDIPRKDIESLVLQKFEGRRDNTFGLMGGVTRTMNEIKEEAPWGYVDLTAFYLRSAPMTPWFMWGASVSYIKLETKDDATPLDNPEMTLMPAMIDLRVQYPLVSLLSPAEVFQNLNFYITCGGGISYVTLTEREESRDGAYLSVQPGVGVSYIFAERVYVGLQCDYLYVHQEELPYKAVRARLAAGVRF